MTDLYPDPDTIVHEDTGLHPSQANLSLWLYQYNKETGAIFATIESPSQDMVDHFTNDRPEINFFVAEPIPNYGDYWFDGEAAVEKQDMELKVSNLSIRDDDNDTAVISGIPDGATVTMDEDQDVTSEVKNGELSVHSGEQGNYLFAIQAKGYRPAFITIKVG